MAVSVSIAWTAIPSSVCVCTAAVLLLRVSSIVVSTAASVSDSSAAIVSAAVSADSVSAEVSTGTTDSADIEEVTGVLNKSFSMTLM